MWAQCQGGVVWQSGKTFWMSLCLNSAAQPRIRENWHTCIYRIIRSFDTSAIGINKSITPQQFFLYCSNVVGFMQS